MRDDDRERDEDEIVDDREPDDVMASLLAEEEADDGAEAQPEPVEEPAAEEPRKAKEDDPEGDPRDPDQVMQDALKDAQKAAEQSDEWGRAKGTLAEIAQATGATKAQVADALLSIQQTLRDNPAVVWGHLVDRVAAGASPEQRAQIVLGLAQKLGVQVPANVLAGAEFDKRIAEHRRAWEVQAQARQVQRDISEADRTLAEFAHDHPHYEQVRYDMGAMMSVAWRQGRRLSLDQAYERAVRAHGLASEPARRTVPAAVGKTVMAQKRLATTPQTRAIAARPADPESDDREPAEIMRELLAGAR